MVSLSLVEFQQVKKKSDKHKCVPEMAFRIVCLIEFTHRTKRVVDMKQKYAATKKC